MGRYDDENFGEVREIETSNLEFGEDGLPTAESLQGLLEELTEASSGGNALVGAYFETDKVGDMQAFVQDLRTNDNREPYSVLSNNCGSFCVNVLNQDQAIKDRSPHVVAPNPALMIHQYTRRADHTVILTPNGNFQFNRKRK